MRKIKITTNKGKVEALLKSSWSEITLKELLSINTTADDNPIRLLSIISGVDFDSLAESSDENLQNELYDLIAFLYEQPDWKKITRPSHLVIGGKPYKVPNIEKETLGQKVMLDQLVTQGTSLISVIPQALAVYFQPIIDGKWDHKRLKEVEELIMETPCLHSHAIAGFFLSSPKNLMRITILNKNLLKPIRLQKSSTRQPLKSTEDSLKSTP